MTLEVLFAQQGQAETFLRMVLLGAAFALALTLGGAWRHRHGLSDAADVLCALMLTLAALLVLIHSGEGAAARRSAVGNGHPAHLSLDWKTAEKKFSVRQEYAKS